jgi:raffinose/stachyose/melibiose transport system permease protein
VSGPAEGVAIERGLALRRTRRSRWRVAWRRHWFVYVFGVVLPVVLFAIFVGYPLVYSVYLSFFSWNGLGAKHYVGLANFRELVDDDTFRTSLVNSLEWIVGTLFFADVVAFLLAVWLRSGKLYLAPLFRVLIFLPVTLSLVAVGLMFAFILDPAFGALTFLLDKVGQHNQIPDLLGNPDLVLYTLIAVFGWTYIGVAMMLFDAALGQVPPELYEAARIDGAGGAQTLRYVTIPSLRPLFVVVTMLAVLDALSAFDLIIAMTNGGPGDASSVLGFFMYRSAFAEQRFGYGASVSTFILAMSAVFAVLYVRRVGSSVIGEKR